MVLEAAWRLGLGVALAWAALPLLVKLARRSRAAPPAEYYRALVAALCIATALIFAPLLRSWSGSPVTLLTLGANNASAGASSVTFVAELVSPLIGTTAKAWHSLPLAQLFAAIGGIWLLLLAAGIAASIWGHVRLQRDYAAAVSAPPRVLAYAERIAAELGVRAAPIHVAHGPAAALSYGALTPIIVISAHACELPDDELEFVLRHELCHIAHHDTRAICVIDIAQRCFAGHPSLPVLAGEIRVAREARADEAAAGARALEYARFLLTVAEHIGSLRAASASLVSMADTALERRVEMLINPDPHPSRLRRSMRWLALTGFILCGLVFLTPMSWGQPERSPGDHPIVHGNLSVEQVEQGLFTNAGSLLECYGDLRAPRANLPMHVWFEIDESGRVSSGKVSVPDHPELEPCLHAALLQRSFARPAGGTVSVEAQALLTPPYDERRAVMETNEGISQRLPAAVIRATVRSYLPQLSKCFEQLGGALTSASISMNFTIARDGTASDGETIDKSEPAADSDAFSQLAQCVNKVRRTMHFPAPWDGIVNVTYPLEFADKVPGSD